MKAGPFTRSTYHRRSVYALLRAHQSKVRGRVLHVGGPRDFWLFDTAEMVTSVEIAPYEGVDVVADGCQLPFRDNSFDTVAAIEVLEHVPTPQIMVNEILRVLKPGGTVLLSTPFIWRIHRTPKDYWRFTDDSLNLLFNHFASCDVIPVNGAKHTLMHVLFQFGEMACSQLRLSPRFLIVLKPVEWIVFLAVPNERANDRSWTTGWMVIATK